MEWIFIPKLQFCLVSCCLTHVMRLEKEGRPSPVKPDFGYARTACKCAPVFFFSLALLEKMAFHTDSYNWVSWASSLLSLVLIKHFNPDWLLCGGLCLTSCVRSRKTNRRINILFLRQEMLDMQTLPVTLSPTAKMDKQTNKQKI